MLQSIFAYTLRSVVGKITNAQVDETTSLSCPPASCCNATTHALELWNTDDLGVEVSLPCPELSNY